MRLPRLAPPMLAAALAGAVLAPAHATPGCTLAITHATLVPMDSERVVPDQTVVVRRDRIVAIGASTARRYRCARTIDARGGYLVPGLNDMHVHIETTALARSFGVTPSPIDFPAELAPYAANGVTGVRVMSGAPDILAFRDQNRGPASALPRLVVATPMLSGEPPVLPEPITKVLHSPEEAREVVRRYRREGYDFVKVRDNLPAPVFRAVIDEARRVGFYVDGHVSQGQGLSVFDVLAIGQKAVAHLDNLQLAITDPIRDPDRLVAAMRACDCFVETTLQVEASAIAQMTDYDRLIARPQLRFMNPIMLRAFWRKPNNPYLKGDADPAFFRQLYANEKTLLMRLHKGGVHIVAGTDALNPMIVPGASLQDELAALVEAGFTPYEALKAATADPAAFVPGFSDVGVLRVGRIANAVLVERNPLRNIAALRSPQAVMINGHWRTSTQLQAELDRAAQLYAGK